MREIKFRAWWKEAKLMADVEVWRENDIVIIVPVVSSIPGHKFERQLLDEGQYELMQFTGLKDKNGIPIFEGDIVRWYSKSSHLKKEKIDVILWVKRSGYFPMTKQSQSAIKKYRDGFRTTYCEIIGNIYENPDLLTN